MDCKGEEFLLEDSVMHKRFIFELSSVDRVVVGLKGYGIRVMSSIFDAEGNQRTNFQRAKNDVSRFDDSGKIPSDSGDVEEIRSVSYDTRDSDCPIYIPNVPWETFVKWGRPERIPVYTSWTYRIAEGEIGGNG
tara:strand:- start:211 stop:612 length:402 start_codon:yes stop_codon:yes gene_type:complete